MCSLTTVDCFDRFGAIHSQLLVPTFDGIAQLDRPLPDGTAEFAWRCTNIGDSTYRLLAVDGLALGRRHLIA